MPMDELKELGLNSTERQVFLSMLASGPAPGAIISKRIGLNRATVYSALATLEGRGLIEREKRKRSTLFRTIPTDAVVDRLRKNLERKQQRQEEALLTLERHIQGFSKQQETVAGGFRVTTFESLEGVSNTLEVALLSGNYLGIFDPQTAMKEPLRDAAKKFLVESAKSCPHIREIAVDGPLAKWWIGEIRNPNHKVKLISADELLLTDVLITEDAVHLNNYAPGEEMAIRITHDHYHHFMVFMFEQLWARVED